MKSAALHLLVAMATMPSAFAFLDNFAARQQQPFQEARPDLIEVVDRQADAKLNIQLHIGNDDTGFLAATDMVVELQHDMAEYDHVPLPGADGYYSDCSSGHRSLSILQKPHFINLEGTQHIDCQMGCWEVCWVKDKPAGTLGE